MDGAEQRAGRWTERRVKAQSRAGGADKSSAMVGWMGTWRRRRGWIKFVDC